MDSTLKPNGFLLRKSLFRASKSAVSLPREAIYLPRKAFNSPRNALAYCAQKCNLSAKMYIVYPNTIPLKQGVRVLAVLLCCIRTSNRMCKACTPSKDL